jgi:DNA polymerase II small subunit/DNA polymerase delta subunit B
MKKIFRLLLWIFLIGIVAGISTVYYVFNKPRRNISKEIAVYSMDARQLMVEFKTNEDLATKKYLNQTIAVKGEITSIRTLTNKSKVFSLEDDIEGVSCTVDSADVVKNASKISKLTKGTIGSFKGRCSGMLMDIQIINCVPE